MKTDDTVETADAQPPESLSSSRQVVKLELNTPALAVDLAAETKFVDDGMALPFTLPAALTGSFAATDGKSVNISGVNELSLPEASR